jgi:putative transcriptional regulator
VPAADKADTVAMGTDAFLTNQLLIAMPGMPDPNFNSTVTLICEHNQDGALGIVINRPLGLTMSGLFAQLDLANPGPSTADDPVFMGGPVGPERGFVLHAPGAPYENSLVVSDDIHLTLSRDIIDAMAAGDGPSKTLVALGYAGWEAGQLEEELVANSWLNVPASPEIVFDTPFGERWMSAAKIIGIDISQISANAGHA